MVDVNYSNIARAYRWLEYLVFASTLQRARLSHLTAFCQNLTEIDCPSIAVVGDGDGRFLLELLKAMLDCQVDYIDCSPGMLVVAKERVGDDSRVSWSCEKFEEMEGKVYDAIVCHFVLDGFDCEHRNDFVEVIAASLNSNGIVLVSDFDSTAHCGAAALVVAMQWFFHACAGVPFVRVTKPDDMLLAQNMTLIAENEWWRRAVFSQIWKM